MPSTYTLNNGIELIATGEQSGTWGDTTNTNLELLDTALDGQVTVTLASAGTSGSPNTLPISDGAASNGRNRLVIFNDGSDLGATAYVQLTPNDAEKIIYVRNSLSGSRSILLFQGTYNASNDYEIPAGTTAIVYFNGGGTGAVAANVFNNAYFDSLRLGSVSVTAILDEDNMASDSATALATQQSIKAYVDTQVGANNELSEVLANGNTTGGTDISVSTGDDITFADSSKAIFGAGSDLQIFHDGTHTYIDETNPTGYLFIRGANTQLLNPSNEIYLECNNNGSVDIYHDNSKKLATTTNGIDVTGTVTADGLTVDGDGKISSTAPKLFLTETDTVDVNTRITSTGGVLYFQSSNDAENAHITRQTIDHSTGDISFYEDTGTTAKFFWDASAESLGIGTSSPLQDLHISSTSGTKAIFERTGSTGAYIGLKDSSGSLVYLGDNNGTFEVQTAGSSYSTKLAVTSAGNVGIGISNPFYNLVVSSGGASGIEFGPAYSGTANLVQHYSRSGGVYVDAVNEAAQHRFNIGGSEKMRIDSSGNVGIGASSPAAKLNVNGNGRFDNSAATPVRLHINNSGSNDYASIYADTTSAYKNLILNPNGGNVGIGTSSTANGKLVVESNGSNLYLKQTTGDYGHIIGQNDADGALTFSRRDGGNTERMRIDASGAVVINNSGGDAQLYLGGTSGTSRMYLARSGSDSLLWNVSNGNMRFGTNNAEAMRIDSSGNLLVGTTGSLLAGARVRASAAAATFEGEVTHAGGSGAVLWANRTSSDGWVAAWYRGGSSVGSISVTSSSTSYNTSSDYRLKENVTDVTDGITRVKQLEPKRFNFIADPDRTVDGFLAHEAQAVVPEAVTGTHNEVDDDGNAVMQGIDQSKLVPLLTAALKEAVTKIETLETEMTSVKARLDALEGA